MFANASLNYSISRSEQVNPAVMLLVHGAGSSHLIWPAQLRRHTGCMVLAIDLSGHGRSAGVPEQSIARYAAQVIRFLDDMGIYRVFMAGHSMGGAIGLQLLMTNPERLSGLALISCGTKLTVPPRILQLFSNPGSAREAISSLEPLLFGSDAAQTLRDRIIKSMQNNRPGLLYSDWLACSGFNMSNSLKYINKPAWIAIGNEDRIVPPAAARQLLTLIPRSRIKYFKHAGHMLIVERPFELSRWLISLPDILLKE